MKLALRISLVSTFALASLAFGACSSSDSGGPPGGGGNNDGGGGGDGGSGCKGDGCFAVDLDIGNNTVQCAAMKDRSVLCWGYAFEGGKGQGDTTQTGGANPLRVVQLSDATGVAIGGDSSCALRTGGAVSCWGTGEYGLGNGAAGKNETPQQVGIQGVQQLQRSLGTTCALLQDRSVWCWGDVVHLVPEGAPITALSPVKMEQISNAKEIALGGGHLCVLYDGGTVSCFGENGHLEVGTDSGASVKDLTPVAGLESVVHISATRGYTCAVLADGTAQCWGQDDGGLGDGAEDTTMPRANPLPVKDLTNVDRIATGVGGNVTCALLKDRTVKCWGQNDKGQMGTGSTAEKQLTPVTIPGATDVVKVVPGEDYVCALRGDGRVICWGNNNQEDFGAKTPEEVIKTPFQVPW